MKEKAKEGQLCPKMGLLVDNRNQESAISIGMESAFNKDGSAISVRCRSHSYKKAGAIPIRMPMA